MTAFTLLQNGEYVGVRELRNSLTHYVHAPKKTYFVTEHGKPKKVLVSYDLFMEMLGLVDEMKDKMLLKMVAESRAAQRKGKSVPLGNLRKELGL